MAKIPFLIPRYVEVTQVIPKQVTNPVTLVPEISYRDTEPLYIDKAKILAVGKVPDQNLTTISYVGPNVFLVKESYQEIKGFMTAIDCGDLCNA